MTSQYLTTEAVAKRVDAMVQRILTNDCIIAPDGELMLIDYASDFWKLPLTMQYKIEAFAKVHYVCTWCGKASAQSDNLCFPSRREFQE